MTLSPQHGDANGVDPFLWDLRLPGNPVSRRASRYFALSGGPHVLADIDGPGCIRRFWCAGNNVGRNVVLRIWFDHEPVPHVEAPIGDFFGLMHNMAFRGKAYRINTPFLTVKPQNGMACSFPMPFAARARIEVTSDGDELGEFVYMIDWHEYPGAGLAEPMRFCCRWRRECPTLSYADQFLMLDADGPGRLAGFAYSVDMLVSRHEMRWSHAGADQIYIDGDGEDPSVLFGIGGEDCFGTSYGGAEYAAQSSLFSDMPCYEQKDPEGDKQKLAAYRFFVHDAIRFRRSIFLRFACRKHDIASTVYWYSSRPVRPFVQMPPVEMRMPGTNTGRRYDLPPPDHGTWWVAGRFEPGFDGDLPTGPVDPAVDYHGAKWIAYPARRGWVEFNDHFGPEPSNEMPTADGVCVAYCEVDAPAEGRAHLRLAWDDHLVLRVNGGDPMDLGNHDYFRSETLALPLHKGFNAIALQLSNTVGLSRGAWCFSSLLTTADGQVLVPRARRAGVEQASRLLHVEPDPTRAMCGN